MKCVICKQADTVPGQATITLERDGMTLVTKGVPARVCKNCGEEYLDDKTVEKLLNSAMSAVKTGVQVEIREYVAA